MFRVQVNKTQLSVIDREPTTSGSSQVYDIEFAFSPDWDGFQKTAVFMAEDERRELVTTIDVLLDSTNRCKIPHEMFGVYGYTVTVGVYGVTENAHILPTVVVDLTEVVRGVILGDVSTTEPTPSVYEQLLARLTSIDEQIANGMLQGPPGPQGERGRKGDIGPKGDPGKDGKSAYRYAVEGGFEGTEEEFEKFLATGLSLTNSTATDEEVDTVLNDIFGNPYEGEDPDDSGNNNGGLGDWEVADEKEVSDMIDDVFGKPTNDPDDEDLDIATDQEVTSVIDDIFGQGLS